MPTLPAEIDIHQQVAEVLRRRLRSVDVCVDPAHKSGTKQVLRYPMSNVMWLPLWGFELSAVGT